MRKIISSVVMGLVCLLTTTGCAPLITPPFSPEVMKNVNKSLTFDTVRQNPESYKGAVILVGGEIIGTTSVSEGVTQIEVNQTPLDDYGVPMIQPGSGRFLILTHEPLDPEKIFPRRRLTVVAEVMGVKRQKLGGMDYPYVLLRANVLHLWQAPGERSLHPTVYYPWEVTPKVRGR